VNQLDLYLKETDIYYKNPVEYWKYRDHKYDILARMARDVLSIPIITVASESAFSPGSCILNKYRSCMVSENLQALVCSHNWFFGFSVSVKFYRNCLDFVSRDYILFATIIILTLAVISIHRSI
jgi:hypothetical protein